MMLIYELTNYCDSEYKSQDTEHVCSDCTHQHECSGGCKNCLEEVHYPTRYPQGKKDYDCSNLINFYMCDYSFKYASEMLYLLSQSEALKEIDNYHIMSIGCGGCPDLMAFESYVLSTYPSKKIQYYGIDKNVLWKPIHNQIKAYLPMSRAKMRVKYVYDDAIDFFGRKTIEDANVIVIQYLISHLYNTNQIAKINQFYGNLISNLIIHRESKNPFVILINDVNSCYRGRDCFKELCDRLAENGLEGSYRQFYFDYRIQNESQRYGMKHISTEILYDIPDGFEIYQPWTQCSSAQLLIEIGRRDDIDN